LNAIQWVNSFSRPDLAAAKEIQESLIAETPLQSPGTSFAANIAVSDESEVIYGNMDYSRRRVD
jgi:hypothetical protein